MNHAVSENPSPPTDGCVDFLELAPSQPIVELKEAEEREYCGQLLMRRYRNAPQRSPEWRELTHQTLGASESAAVFPTATPLQLRNKLLRKREATPDPYLVAAMQEGVEMEPVLLAEVKSLFPHRLVYQCDVFVLDDPQLGTSLRASPDALIIDEHKCVIVELKWRTTDSSSWNGALGITVFCQVQHQMLVTGARSAYVYCGCRAGSRSMWLVNYSVSFIRLWRQWCRKTMASLHLEKRKPNSRGTKAMVTASILYEIQQHSWPIRLPRRVAYQPGAAGTGTSNDDVSQASQASLEPLVPL